MEGSTERAKLQAGVQALRRSAESLSSALTSARENFSERIKSYLNVLNKLQSNPDRVKNPKTSPLSSGSGGREAAMARERERGGSGVGERGRRRVYGNAEVKVERLYVADAHKLVPRIYTFGYDFKNWNEYWAILNTGELYFGLPPGDFHNFDYETERRENPHRFRPYKLDKNLISGFEYNGREISFELGQESVAVDSGTIFKRVDPCTNFRFNGVFRHEAYADAVESANANGLPGQTTFQFSEDGNFKVKGCSSGRCLLPRPHAWELRERGRRIESRGYDAGVEREGLYHILENKIELEYSDGSVERAFFFRYPGDEAHILSINGVNYFKQEGCNYG